MSLTGVPLLVVCWMATKLAVGATIIGWRHGGRVRVLTRTLSILVCEAVALFSLGVVANRAFDLYPSWAALLHPVQKPKSVAAPTARLDGWLHARDATSAGHGVLFTWEPPGWTDWGLARAPQVFVPQAYLKDAGLRFPVVVVAGPPTFGPTTAVTGATSAIVVVIRPARAGVDAALTEEMPYALGLDLRVSAHGWALVGVGTDASLAIAALAERPERYQEAALVATGPAPVSTRVRRGFAEQPLCLVAAASTGTVPAGMRVLRVPAAPARLAAALTWVYGLLPAPLNPPETGPVGIPPKPKPRVHPSGSAAP